MLASAFHRLYINRVNILKMSYYRLILLIIGFLLPVTNLHANPVSDYSLHNHTQFFFSKPFSGKKVDHYEVSLEFPHNENRKYLVPDDCSKVINDVTFGSPKPVDVIARNLWNKVINDCHYVSIMPPIREKVVHDFVSDYDYFNARLSDLPFASECEASDDAVFQRECLEKTGDKLSISSLFPFLEISSKIDGASVEECRFTEGVFRGRLIRTESGISCQADKRAKGLRLLSVDHGDLNHDGYEDVVLRIMPLGRGVSRLPILLPLTRYDDKTSFSIPKGVSVDIMLRRY